MRQQVVQRIEAEGENRRPVRLGEAVTIAKVLGISLDDLIDPADETSINEELDEALYQAERAVRALQEHVSSTRGAHDRYAQVIRRAESIQDDAEPQRIRGAANLDGLDFHHVSLQAYGPVYSLQREMIQGILRSVGLKLAPVPKNTSDAGPYGRWDWINCLSASWALLEFDSLGHQREDTEHLAIFRDALHVVGALQQDYEKNLKALREAGYVLDDEVLALSGLASLGEEGPF